MSSISALPSTLSIASTAFSSAAPSDHGESSSPTSYSEHTSRATTPEPRTPESKSPAMTQHAFEHRPVYDESLLPRIPKTQPVQPLALDAQNPDHWVPRDERMVRLTGKHPYNVEAPLSALFSQGFLTPQNLFYVRNHGYVPQVTQQQARDWKLRIHGLVERDMEFTIQDLKENFPVVTLPITLVCAGNRRKEQNVVTKGLGFNWGAAGVSTGLFTGVYLSDILKFCRPKRPLLSAYPSYDTVVPGRARHVIFEGIDELPKGKYGTSQRLSWAMDQEKGMLIAWGLNGEDLAPDHGFPLRLVVPGQIGGRMVKWLNRIEVSDRESQHYLHFFDNKLLPTQLSADQARDEKKWWYDPKYIINELNVNAALCSPNHNEIVKISSDTVPQKLPLQGYAYTGGGRRITRVEISLDDGQTWQLADITYPEDLYRMYPVQEHPYFGKLDLSMTDMSFCWCFWTLEVDTQQLVDQDVKVISVRAGDESLQAMPRDMMWTAMSMMNSWWFRVAVHRTDDGSLRFEHPAPVDEDNRGWMMRMKEEGRDPRFPHFGGPSPFTAAASAPAAQVSAKSDLSPKEKDLALMLNPDKISTVITAAQLAEHGDSDGPEPWFVVHGHVFDGTGYLNDHPGGAQSIQLVAGEDATEDFLAIHSADAKKMLREYHLGKLEHSASLAGPAPVEEAQDPSKPFLEPKKWKRTRLVHKKTLSHDSRLFRFALAHDDQLIGLPTGQHVYLRIKTTNKATGEVDIVQRAYTPYSGSTQRGYLDILIKVYFPCEAVNQDTAAFTGGKMTMLLEKTPVGIEQDDVSIELKGPVGHFTYLGSGQVDWKPAHRARNVKKLAMIAGGSGITPIWSTLKAIADEYIASPPAEPIQIWLLYGNRTEEDILIREELETLEAALGGNLHIWHILSLTDKLAETWKMGRGHVNAACLREHLPPPPPAPVGEELEDTLALVCGPPAMEKGVSAALAELGWDLDRTHLMKYTYPWMVSLLLPFVMITLMVPTRIANMLKSDNRTALCKAQSQVNSLSSAINGTYNWCNMPHVRRTEYPRVNASYALEYVEVIHRHHKRTPYATNTLPVESYPWHCDDEASFHYAAPSPTHGTNQSANTYHKVYTSPVNPFIPRGFQGTCQFPQITRGGLDDSWQHGSDLYHVYHHLLGFLPEKYDPGLVSFRVTNNLITSQVASMVASGMFGDQTRQNFPLSIQPASIDSLEPAYRCLAAKKLFSEYGVGSKDPGWVAHLEAASSLYAHLDPICGISPADQGFHESFDHYFDNLSARLCHAKPLPCNVSNPSLCVTQAMADQVFRLGQYEYSYLYRDAGERTLAYSVGVYGVWIAELAQNLRDAMSTTEAPGPRYRHNVAHDGSISYILSILQGEEMVWPGMGSEVVFELYKKKGTQQYFIRVLWSGQVMRSSSPILGVLDMLDVDILLTYFDGLVGPEANKIQGMCSL
ncbi:hypothetical protein B0I35DRAFT_412101 [Stachybotrys elegans]|uniref:Nitrate reductase [NADPH] n=1 Tax=Stachybotrys elegans TaxID=80388 RepID=A0A8K0SK42_9HYPO|nr:hypothetical protein B0I35DRAFT_412101 [Stachybotrys elegans]